MPKNQSSAGDANTNADLGDDPRDKLRRLTDARELRALAHPVRIALLELISLEGTVTATEAAGVLGGTPANAAYHLRTLAKHGYVVEAESGVGRERPWRLAGVGLRFEDEGADPAMQTVGKALVETLQERWIARARHYRDHREEYPEEVRKLSGNSQFLMFGSAAEVEQVQLDIMRVLTRYQERIFDPSTRPEGAHAFEFILASFPFDQAAIADATDASAAEDEDARD